MEINIKYHVEIVGQVSHDGQTIFECTSFEEGIKKLKSMRSVEVHAHLIKTIEKGNKVEKILVD